MLGPLMPGDWGVLGPMGLLWPWLVCWGPEWGDMLLLSFPGITICSSWARLLAAGPAWPGVEGLGVWGPPELGVREGAGEETGEALGLCAGDCVLGAGEFWLGDICGLGWGKGERYMGEVPPPGPDMAPPCPEEGGTPMPGWRCCCWSV